VAVAAAHWRGWCGAASTCAVDAAQCVCVALTCPSSPSLLGVPCLAPCQRVPPSAMHPGVPRRGSWGRRVQRVCAGVY
jgi:hypothetical protein